MGGSSSSPEPAPAVLNPAPANEALQAAQEQLQAAVDAPITQQETGLWSRTGKACTWADAGEYDKRLTQLQIINYAIRVLAQETWKNADVMDFATLHQKVMTYVDVDGALPAQKERYDWKVLSEDESFPRSQDSPVNIFKEFEYVFAQAIGANEKELKKLFEKYMTRFIRIRDTLMVLLAQSCQ